MPRRPAPASLVLGVALATAASATAQQPREIRAGFRDTLTAAWADLLTRCVTPVDLATTASITRAVCQVRGATSLGSEGGTEWSVVRYLREVIVADTAWADTMPLDELVLVGRAPGADSARVVWHLVRERTFEFLDTLLWTPTARGTFLEVRICLNGTGGCSTEYLRFRDDAWRAVAQPFVRALQQRLPPDHRLHKGRRLDLATLDGVWPVAAPGDANCCPSFELPFRLELEGDSLRLVEAGPLRWGRRP